MIIFCLTDMSSNTSSAAKEGRLEDAANQISGISFHIIITEDRDRTARGESRRLSLAFTCCSLSRARACYSIVVFQVASVSHDTVRGTWYKVFPASGNVATRHVDGHPTIEGEEGESGRPQTPEYGNGRWIRRNSRHLSLLGGQSK